MTVQSAPIVSLQAPKDVSLNDIEAELSKIWQSYGLMVATEGLLQLHGQRRLL